MTSKEIIKKIIFRGYEIELPFPVEAEITSDGYNNMINVFEEELKLFKQKLKQLEKENHELKQLVKEQFEKIQRDSGKMASMACELRRLKGEFIPQECEG